MKKTNFIFLLVIPLLILISSCSKEIPDCSSQNTPYEKYKYDKVAQKCIVSESIQENVCGNNIKEKGETYCNCKKDVPDKTISIEEGGCSGGKGEFLTYECNSLTKKCELFITDKVKKNSKLLSLREGGNFALDAQVNYFFPFMMYRHKVNIEILLNLQFIIPV